MRRQLLAIAVIPLLSACSDESATSAPSADVIAAAAGDEIRGFVFTNWGYEIPRDDPGECPDGFNVT